MTMETPTPEQQERYIAIWAKAVETQMHFNEMSVKSRQLGLAFVAAALGVSIVLLSRKEDFSFSFGNVELHISVVLLLAALVALLAVKRLDLGVYHRMLRGAVTFGEDFEEHYMKRIFSLEKGMTQSISHFSRYDDAARQLGTSGMYTYTGTKKVTAEQKIRAFYRFVVGSLLMAALALFLVQNIELWTGKARSTTPTSARAPEPSERSSPPDPAAEHRTSP